MQVGKGLMIAAALLGCSALAASDEDEAWIERFMSQPGQSARPASIQRGYHIAWRDLPRFVGVPVKIVTDKGSVHSGPIERVDANSVVLRSRMHGGYAQMTLRRDQVASTEMQ